MASAKKLLTSHDVREGPTIIQSYGNSPIHTQLLTAAPWSAALVWSLVLAWASDKAQHRFGFIVGPIVLSITGFGMLLAVHKHFHTEYAALFLQVMGTLSVMPLTICWFSMNLNGHVRRSVGTAWQIGFGSIGGIISTFAFQSKDAPYYTMGYGIGIGFSCLTVVSACWYFVALWLQNRKGGDRSTIRVDDENETGTVLHML